MPDQFRHVDTPLDVGDQRRLAHRAGQEVDIGRARARRAADAARRMARRLAPQLARRGAVEQPAGEPPVLDAVAGPGRHPFALERTGTKPALTVRIAADDNALRESPPPHPPSPTPGFSRV